MSILPALQSAALRLIGRKPTAFFGSTQKFEMEICDLVNEVAADIAKYQDWQALTQLGTVTGDGETADFATPADYDRMLLSTEIQDLSAWFWGFRHEPDVNAFLALGASGFQATPGTWIIYGDRLRFTPAPTAGQVATFPYISKYRVRENGGPTKELFTADTDAFLLPERLLTLGLVWRWRENKGLASNGDQDAFTKALDEVAAKDRGPRTFRRNRVRSGLRTYPAWPGTLGPATY